MNKTPLSQVKAQFGSKDKLVDALLPILEKGGGPTDEDKESLKRRLSAASNAKLLRLFHVANWAKDHGGRGKITDGLLEGQKRSKDEGYRTRMGRTPLASLVAQAKQSERHGVGLKRPLTTKPAARAAASAAPRKRTKKAST